VPLFFRQKKTKFRVSSRIDALKLSRCLLFCVCKRVTKMVVCAKKKVIKKFVLRARDPPPYGVSRFVINAPCLG